MESLTPGSLSRNFLDSKGYYLALAIVTVGGLFLRLNQLGTDALWLDEAFTGFLALTHDWFPYVRNENTPPLYYLFMRLWCGIVTCNEFGLRLPSALAGTGFIVLVAVFTARVFGRGPALFVALFTALAPIHVYYSQEARVYSILLTGLLLFLFLQWRIVTQQATRVRLLFLFLVSLGVLYLHFLALIVVGACLAIYATERITGIRTVPFGYFLAVGSAMVLLAPWLFLGIFSEDSKIADLSWITRFFDDKSLWELPFRSLTTYLVGPVYRFEEANLFMKRYAGMDPTNVLYFGSALATFLFLSLYVLSLARVREIARAGQLLFLEASAVIVLSLVGLLVASVLLYPIYVVGRYDLIAFPAFSLVFAGTVHTAMIRSGLYSHPIFRAAIGGALALLLGMEAYRVTAYKSADAYNSTIRGDVAAVVDRISSGDGLLVATPQAIQVWFHLHAMGFDRVGDQCVGSGKRFMCRIFPLSLEQAPASVERYFNLPDTEQSSFEISYFLEDLSNSSNVVLLPDRVAISDNQIEIDPIGGALASIMLDKGFVVDASRRGDSIVVFTRNPASRE